MIDFEEVNSNIVITKCTEQKGKKKKKITVQGINLYSEQFTCSKRSKVHIYLILLPECYLIIYSSVFLDITCNQSIYIINYVLVCT